ncbi:hypothetical protein [Ralstonia pseudosolanacearum]|uniref:hypothetical protein n=1 Tax=Ralstonia pseudosolanacearum TaxID=1310165 RepID=UPI003390FF0C
MSKKDLETSQLSLDFASREEVIGQVPKAAHRVVRRSLAVVVSNTDAAVSKQSVRPRLTMVETRDIYASEVTAELHRCADALGW